MSTQRKGLMINHHHHRRRRRRHHQIFIARQEGGKTPLLKKGFDRGKHEWEAWGGRARNRHWRRGLGDFVFSERLSTV